MKTLATLLVCFLVVFTSGTVWASGAISTGSCTPLITPQYGECKTASLDNIFSGYVCQYEEIVADVFSQVYCAVKTEYERPLTLLLTLFMAIFGAAILTGAVPFTQKELMLALLRIGMLAGFVIQAEFVVTYLYAGVVGFMESGVEVVMSAADASANRFGVPTINSGANIYERLDQIIRDFTGSSARESAGNGNPCRESILPMMVTMMFVIPPLFLLGVMVAFRLIISFLRAVVGYLFALTVIMFLVVLSPIFLGAGLFRETRPLFNKWVEYLLSMAIQVVVTFAFIGLILSMGILEDFGTLRNVSVEYRGSTWQTDARVQFNQWCTICTQPQGSSPSPGRFQFTGCADNEPVPPTGMSGFLQIARFIAMEGLNILLLAFLIDAVLKLAPSVALALGKVPTAPQVSGRMFDQIAGVGSLQQVGTNMSQAFMRGSGGLPGRIRDAGSAGYDALLGRGPNSRGGVVNDIINNLIGTR
jgi:hypothetical protein